MTAVPAGSAAVASLPAMDATVGSLPAAWSPVVWTLVAMAALLVPGRRRTGSRASPESEPGAVGHRVPGSSRAVERPAPAGMSRTVLAVALLALAGACVALLGVRVGGVCALVACPSAALGLRALERRPVSVPPDRSVALALDLAAAALHSGRPLADALALAAPAARADTRDLLLRVAGLLRLGADPVRAWNAVPRASPLAAVATVATRSATSGIRLAAAFERLAVEIRAEVGTAAAQRAYRAGVTAMAPLAACFLPSFVCLGIAPVIVGIARTALGVLP